MNPGPEPPKQPTGGALLPEWIGAFQILGVLGEGGMAVVYRAQQSQPHRTVALKLIKQGVISTSALRRFDHEVELLGRLQHPGIAQVFEAGSFDGGDGPRPYFAMELIEGAPLTEYVQQANLSLEDRLRLFCSVCDAVHHAHQKGIIHRDLKPANILVDEAGRPKILDFGVARATDRDLLATTMHTEVGQLVGTLAYMSPEQAGGENADLDARSDVYALGVILSEILTGKLPYDLREKMLHEVIQAIREEDPPPLSAHSRILRGDLDTIVGKALAKEKEHRYQGALEFASDIKRYLRDEPIAARRPSAIYQVRKFARRNKALVAGVVGVFLALVVGLVGSSLGYFEAKRQAARAHDEARRAQLTASFLTNILAGVDSKVAQGKDTALLKQLLDDAAARIATELADVPLIEADIRSTIGATYLAICDYPSAVLHIARAVEILLAERGPRDRATIREQRSLAVARGLGGDRSAQEAELRRLLALSREILGEEDVTTDEIACQLGILYWKTNRTEQAGVLLEKSLAFRREVRGDDHPDTLIAINSLGLVRLYQSAWTDAERLLQEAYDRRLATQGPLHPETLVQLHNLAGFYADTQQFSRSQELYRDALARLEQVAGPDHVNTIRALNNLGASLNRTMLYEEAEALLEDAVQRSHRSLGPDHPETVDAECELAELYRRTGRADQAVEILERIVAIRRRRVGQDNKETWADRSNLAAALEADQRGAEALELRLELLATAPRSIPPDAPDFLTLLNDLGLQYVTLHREDEAEDLFRRALAGRRQINTDPHFDTLVSCACLANILENKGRRAEEVALRAEGVRGWSKLLGDTNQQAQSERRRLKAALDALVDLGEHESAARTLLEFDRRVGAPASQIAADLTLVGTALVDQARGEEAEALLDEALDLQIKESLEEGPEVARTLLAMGRILAAQERLEEAESFLRESFEELAADDPRRAIAARTLAELYEALDDPDEAGRWREELDRRPDGDR